MLIWLLKLSLLSIWTPKSFTDQANLFFLLFFISCFYFHIWVSRFTFIWKNILEIYKLLLLLTQLIAVLHSDSKIKTSYLIVFGTLDNVLLPKIMNQYVKVVEKILDKVDQKTEPFGAPDRALSNSLYLLFIWTHCWRSS